MSTYANSTNQIAALKELYKDDKEYMKDLVQLPYAETYLLDEMIRKTLSLHLFQKTSRQMGLQANTSLELWGC